MGGFDCRLAQCEAFTFIRTFIHDYAWHFMPGGWILSAKVEMTGIGKGQVIWTDDLLWD
jgi:hypothetical protein